MARACPSGKKSCGKSCIPSAASCCRDDGVLSQYCNEGAVCNNQSDNPTVWWCCPKSKPKCSIIDPNTAFPEFGIPGVDGDSGSGSSGSGSSGSGSSGSGSSSSSDSNSDGDKSGSSGTDSNSGSGNSNSNGNGSSDSNGNSNNDNNQNQGRPKGFPSKNAATRDVGSAAAIVLAAAAVMAV